MRSLLMKKSRFFCIVGLAVSILFSASIALSATITLPLRFDFESGSQGWALRENNGTLYGIPGSVQVVPGNCPSCEGAQVLEFQVDLHTAPENRGQVAYILPTGSTIPPDTVFGAWVWVPVDAPPGLEADFLVQSGAGWTIWRAGQPSTVLRPGQWTRVTAGDNWGGVSCLLPVQAIGLEIKTHAGYPVPVGAFSVRIDDVALSAPGTAAIYLPLVLRTYSLPKSPQVVWDYRGASIAGYWQSAYAPQGNAYALIDQLKATGVNAVTILSTWYQYGFTTTEIVTASMTPKRADIAALIDYAHAQGMQVVLKPHIDPFVGWRAHISPTNAAAWFENFKTDFIGPYAELAEEHDVEMLVIGAEYETLVTPAYVDHWAGVISYLRQVYSGRLTYAATEKTLLSGVIPDWFWESLDVVSLTLYHEFSRERTPDVARTVQNWLDSGIIKELESFHKAYGLPVLLAEVGYRSIDYAGFEASRTEGPNANNYVNPERSIAYNGTGQANMYEALFQVLGDKEWLAGIFMWQYVPDGGSPGEIRGGRGNTDYAILGKPAALTVHNWFGGPLPPPAQWDAGVLNPLVDDFVYWSPGYVPYAWQVAASGMVTFTVDTTIYPPVAVSRSLQIATSVPLGPGRFQQMDYFFPGGDRDWSAYNSLALWLRADPGDMDLEGCELAIGLIDGRSPERELWQSSQSAALALDGVAPGEWGKVEIALSGASLDDRDPWRHPTDFAVPEWVTPSNGVLDLTAIRGVRLKTLATGDNGADYCRVWVGPLQASTRTVEIIYPPVLPVLDAFEYASPRTAGRVWRIPDTLPGTVKFLVDTERKAPVDSSTRALHIQTHIPCGPARFGQISNYLLGGGVNLSAYSSLEIWAGGDLVDAPPYGGEFSVVLEDKDGEHWQSTRWLGRTIQGAEYVPYGLEPVRLSLTSFITDSGANPWHHPADFVLTDVFTTGNHYLDRDWIRAITLKTLTTDAGCATYTDFNVVVDNLVASTDEVIPPQLVNLPVIDTFEYADKETTRLIWKQTSSRQVNVTIDTAVHAPGDSTRSLHIHSFIPTGAERFAQVYNVFLTGAQDLSDYQYLNFWARTAGVAPWGGELSVELVETNAAGDQEIWRNTRWFGNSTGEWLTLNLLAGATVPADSWDPAYKDTFVVPDADSFVDGVLDLTSITGIRIIPLTTSSDAQEGYPAFDIWIDQMAVTHF